jgi:Ca2+-transporting ATPase
MHIGEYWSEPEAEVLQRFRTTRSGLREEEAARRFQDYGENELPHEKPQPDIWIFIEQFASPLVFLLFAAFALSVYIGHISDAVFIGIFILLNAGVGFYQERKAAHALSSLRRLVTIRSRVIRAGVKKEIDSRNLVPGDIIELSAGDKVPADARILWCRDLKINESSLTGEWLAAEKSPEPVAPGTPLAEASSAAFMGTLVESGAALALVVATASDSEIGHIVSLVSVRKLHKTPLQRSVATLARVSGGMIIVVLLAIILLGELRGTDLSETIVTAVALAVSAIPAGLLPAVTVILSLGMRRILKDRALVRHLVAGETLGAVSVICTDKTGTLTEAKMEVSHIVPCLEMAGHKSDDQTLEEARLFALRAAVLGTEAFIENPDDEMHAWVIRGRPTERALVLAAERRGIARAKLESQLPLLEGLSFSSDAKFSVLVREIRGADRQLFVVGAPEVLLARTDSVDLFGKKAPLDDRMRSRLWQKLDALAAEGNRVVAIAERRLHKGDEDTVERLAEKLTLMAFIGLRDPVRADAPGAVETVRRAGVRTLIVTGDHPLTAAAVAKEVGLDSSQVLTGSANRCAQ